MTVLSKIVRAANVKKPAWIGLTIMVNTTIISQHQGLLPAVGQDRKIKGGPLYKHGPLMALLENVNENQVVLWTQKCGADAAKLDFSRKKVAELVRHSLIYGSFRGSEWCQSKPGGPWAACDAYAVTREEWCEALSQELSYRYYVKFCLGVKGNLMIVASCHLDEFRR